MTDKDMPLEIWAAEYHDVVEGEIPLKEWRETKITGSTRYVRADTAKDDVGELLAQVPDKCGLFSLVYFPVDDVWEVKSINGVHTIRKTPAEAIRAAMQKINKGEENE